MKKVLLVCMLMITCFFIAPCCLYAQDDFPDDLGETDVPFDNGSSLLVIAGVAYGIKMMYDKKKNEHKM